jgi:hypothetical protein
MTDPSETLRRIKEQADAATRAPWTAQDYDHNPGDQGVPIIGGGEAGSMEGHLTAYAMTLFDEDQAVADGAFIAASRTTVPRLAGALQAVLDLHQPEKRYMPYEDADVSFDTEREALEASGDVYLNSVSLEGLAEKGAPYFEVCAHCKTVEEGPCEGRCTSESGYLTSIWPCPTWTAIIDQLGDNQ